jgi:hypothetical protein
MNGIESSTGLWLWAIIHVLGLVSAWLARVSECSGHYNLGYSLFLGCLAMVGIATVIALASGPGLWVISAAILAVMILIGTCDFRGETQMAAN